MKKNLLIMGGVTLSILAVTVPVMAQPQPGESGAGLPISPPEETSGGPGGGPGGGLGGPDGGRQFGGGQGGPDDAQRQEHRQRMLERFDTNHDGKLDDNERAQMHQFMQQRRMMREQQNGGQGGPPGGPGGQGFGQQGQGPGGQGSAQWQEHRQKMLERFDTNHDGQLDDGERAQMHEFMQQRKKMREQQDGGPSGTPPAPSQQ